MKTFTFSIAFSVPVVPSWREREANSKEKRWEARMEKIEFGGREREMQLNEKRRKQDEAWEESERQKKQRQKREKMKMIAR